MTREEAIKRFNGIINAMSISIAQSKFYPSKAELNELCGMAIEALHREEAEEKGYCHRIRPSNVEVVVRCKDCKHWSGNGKMHNNHLCKRALDQNVEYWTRDDDYCSYGERKGGDSE